MSSVLRRIRARSLAVSWRAPRIHPAPDAPPDAVRPLGLLTFEGRGHDAWFCHPPAQIVDDVHLPAGGTLRLPVALLPEGRQADRAGIVFTVTISRRTSGRTHTITGRVRPTQAARWIDLSCAVPPPADAADTAATLRVQTSIPPDGSSAWAWAVVGAPTMDVPRSLRELTTITRTFVSRVRHEGWPAAWSTAHARLRPVEAEPYTIWLQRNEPTPSALQQQREVSRTWTDRPLVSIITPAYNTQPDWLRECYASLDAQTYDRWEWCVCNDASPLAETRLALDAIAQSDKGRVRLVHRQTNGGISAASNDALALATGELIVLLDHDDVLAPSALWEVVSAFRSQPDRQLLYSDEDKLDETGTRCDPYFKPDWSPELFEATMYACHLTAARRALVTQVGGFRQGFEGAQDYDLWLRMLDVAPAVHHIQKVLYHWRKVPGSTASAQSEKPWASDAGHRALAAMVERRGSPDVVEPGPTAGRYRVRRVQTTTPVSILVPTFGAHSCPATHASVVERAIVSLAETTAPGRIEVVVATEDGTVPAVVARALRAVPHHLISVPGPFNFSQRINAAAAAATHPMLLVGNDDLEALTPGWLDAMLDYAERPAIGAVGPRLDLPDGRVQHVGLLLGVCGLAAHAFHHAPAGHQGYFGTIISPRNVSAVTGACLMTRADVFAALGGMDEALARDFNDVDYCLRAQQRGLRIVYTPYARLRHHEGPSLGLRAPSDHEQQLMRTRWAPVIARDPFFNPNLSPDHVDYRLR
jgi:O-antigen biosynthesis protein